MAMIEHKRGATFSWVFTLPDPGASGVPLDSGWTVRCEAEGQVYGPQNYGARIVLRCTVIDAAARLVEVFADAIDAQEWLLGHYVADFRISQGAVVVPSDNWALVVVREATGPEEGGGDE